jgi:lipopolysaccharide assembly outer membrane protein LptD (OstA)
MKLLMTVAIAYQFAVAPHAICQDNRSQPERLHLTRPFPQSSPGRVELTASNIQRDLSSKERESIIHLRGNVEVRMVTCGPAGRDDAMACDKGSMVLHADEVDYNEKTGEINARGDVRVTPYQPSARQ